MQRIGRLSQAVRYPSRLRHRLVRLAVTAIACCVLASPLRAEPAELVVFAASSTKTLLDELMRRFTAQTGVKAVASYAATSVLARQVERGAPADLVLTANQQWMKHLADRQLVEPGSRTQVAGNRLVLISHRDHPLPADLLPMRVGMPLLKGLGGGRLAIADPRHVPAGGYARDALRTLQLWPAVKDRLAPAGNVRLALTLVSRGNSPLGIVYQSDLVASRLSGDDSVQLVAQFPVDAYPTVQYLVGRVVMSRHPEANRFIRYLVSPDVDSTFERLGFLRSFR